MLKYFGLILFLIAMTYLNDFVNKPKEVKDVPILHPEYHLSRLGGTNLKDIPSYAKEFIGDPQ